MEMDEKQSDQGVVYEVRALTNRWVEPMAGTVVSSHRSAKAAMDAFQREPQTGSDGGRSTSGNYQAKAVVRVDTDGSESVLLPPPAGGGLLKWPYTN